MNEVVNAVMNEVVNAVMNEVVNTPMNTPMNGKKLNTEKIYIINTLLYKGTYIFNFIHRCV